MREKTSRILFFTGAIFVIPFLLVTIQYFLSEGKLSPSVNQSIRISSIDYLGQKLDSHLIIALKDWINSFFCLGLLFWTVGFFPELKKIWGTGSRWKKRIIMSGYVLFIFILFFNFLTYFSPKLGFDFSSAIRLSLLRLDPSYVSPEEISACYQKHSYDTIRPELDKYRQCHVPSDCVVIRGTICGFQSGTLVSSKYVDQAQQLINSCPSGPCHEDTFGIQVEPDCVNKQCKFRIVDRP